LNGNVAVPDRFNGLGGPEGIPFGRAILFGFGNVAATVEGPTLTLEFVDFFRDGRVDFQLSC